MVSVHFLIWPIITEQAGSNSQ